MPAFETSFAAASNNLATEKRNCKIKPTLVLVDNQESLADAIITINDTFTPSVTAGSIPVPASVTVPRIHMTVPAGECDSLEDELKDIEFLGLVTAVRGILDPFSFITFAYHLE